MVITGGVGGENGESLNGESHASQSEVSSGVERRGTVRAYM